MWLPHYLSVFLWISHLTLYANATKLWFPYKVDGDLVPPTTLGDDALVHFRNQFSTLSPGSQGRRNLLRQSITYLASKPQTPEHLRAWIDEMDKTIVHSPVDDEDILTITYGLHTLVLKNHGKEPETHVLESALKDYKHRAALWHFDAPYAVYQSQVWHHEMFVPQKGLGNELRSWSTLSKILEHEPRLDTLRLLMDNQRYNSVPKELSVIKEIFSSKPPGRLSAHSTRHGIPAVELSSQTRVAAIALLFHIMYIPGDVGRQADWMATWMVDNCFFFPHEKTLLEKNRSDFRTVPRP
ncbi:hypothetical protein PCASD_05529 [Puccinia coronata f. sp. avenae]|uniref:Alginate lyase domain-containing protein n=1 Tax=Puccinia coronata f. sp. avenae TaxID=200324 RepID=A0A2N5UVQ8_9BASI|nr:hypothetical protein PCASD_05529 [Puccinia coronata f. sp. avenae]